MFRSPRLNRCFWLHKWRLFVPGGLISQPQTLAVPVDGQSKVVCGPAKGGPLGHTQEAPVPGLEWHAVALGSAVRRHECDKV